METSLPKRRKTSPNTAVPLQHTQETKSTEPQLNPLAKKPKRPSFASPTKASLERHNPDILRRRESSPKKPRQDPNAPPPASRPATTDSPSPEVAAQLERRAETGGEEDALPKSRGNGARQQPQGDREGSHLQSPARRPGGGSLRTTRPNPRPLPPPGPEDDEEILNPFQGRRLPRSPIGDLPEAAEPEPELPPTPEHPDPVVSTPPSGIHNTPSKRPRRSKALAERLKSSSPLKQPIFPSEVQSIPSKLPSKLSRTVIPPLEPEEAPTTKGLRRIGPPDPDAAKKKVRDSLLAEIADLERDLNVASQENERIRQAKLSKNEPSPPTNRDEILQLLRRHALSASDREAADPAPAASAWLYEALNPIMLLPFSKGPLPALPVSTESEAALPPVVSHHPLPMKAAEALAYLQVFTPLTFTSHISPLPVPAEYPSGPLLQRHTISTSSTSPRGLFAARIEMTVNTKTLAITELSVPQLDPASEAELSPFIARIVAADTQLKSSALWNNVSVLAWAMGEWLRVAVQRAKVWSILDRELGGDKTALARMVARTRDKERKQQRRRKAIKAIRGQIEYSDDDDDDDHMSDNDGGGGQGGSGEDRDKSRNEAANLLPFMGKTSLDFDIPLLSGSVNAVGGDDNVSTLRVQWRINFDWTGEARSDLGVLVGVPGKWHKYDEKNQLSGLPALFDKLIEAGEKPLTAVRTVVSLLAGDHQKS
ncbi:hypothetical protein B0H63DRAFT_215681 [Podospora didyma]|uniref:Uncharacterized protein n=1 Tax=Podospora didyma TaxID=330526 RepID=A0AAE0NI60_9PEZI|nr:hypothetical protein B0H63DRAFT_215681 [Podospora didyma]